MSRKQLAFSVLCISIVGLTVNAGETNPRDIRPVVADGKHNAFTALVRWKNAYWLSFRAATDHGSRDGDLVVLRSMDATQWHEVFRLNIFPDDRDPQFLATPERLFLYDPARKGGSLTSFVTYTEDGMTWSEPQQVYKETFIFWKPVVHGGKFYATAHVSASNGTSRKAHLITSNDGLKWEKISQIRGGNWESETTIHFRDGERIVAFLRQIRGNPQSSILESEAPYTTWSECPQPLYLAGHSAYAFDGVTYLFSRSSQGEETGTRVYVYENDELRPYCDIPSGGDCSYPAAVRLGDEMLASYYSSHEGSTNIYTCRIPLRSQ